MSLSDEPNKASPEPLFIGGEPPAGYKKPPKSTQFKPGQSGNPKGRPKGSTSTAMLLKKVLAKPVSHTENGVLKKVSRDEAILLTLTAKAVKGDFKSTKLTLDLKERFKLNQEAPPHTNIIVTFEDVDSERQAAIKLEDEYFNQLNREKHNLVVTEIPDSKSRK